MQRVGLQRSSLFLVSLRRFSSINRDSNDGAVSFMNSKAKDFSIIKQHEMEEEKSKRRMERFRPFGICLLVWLVYFCYFRDPEVVMKENEAFDQRQQQTIDYLTSLGEKGDTDQP